MNYKIAVIPGDGIGPEIVREAKKVLDAAGKKYGFQLDYTELLMGGASIDLAWKDGTLTKAVLYDACEELEVCLVYQGEKKTIPLKPGERKEW